jgi:uncharacterized protein (TIGR02145 family)
MSVRNESKPEIQFMTSYALEESIINHKSAMSEIQMQYNTGDILKFTGYSGNSKTVTMDVPTGSKSINFELYNCVDADKQSYSTVTIGKQIWMAENLAYLPTISAPSSYSYTKKEYYVIEYNGTNLEEAKQKFYRKEYGVLYNYPAALNACPTGWHLPSNNDWNELADYLGGANSAGGKLKNMDNSWETPNTGATNISGFSALSSGVYSSSLGFTNMYRYAEFWSSTPGASAVSAHFRLLSFNNQKLTGGDSVTPRDSGLSVRCVKD